MTWTANGKYVFDRKGCVGIFDTDNDTEARMEAKAILAAAAPDLLEALELAEGMLMNYDNFRNEAVEMAQISAAIAKAKGKHQ